MVSLTLTPPAPWQAAHTVATFALPASMSAACASGAIIRTTDNPRSEEHTSELQSPCNLVCRLLLEKKKPAPENERWDLLRAPHPNHGNSLPPDVATRAIVQVRCEHMLVSEAKRMAYLALTQLDRQL